MPTLRFDEKKAIEKLTGGDNLFSTAARLYQASPNPREFTYSGVGAVTLTKRSGNAYIVLVDLSKNSVAWEQDISKDVKYLKDKPHFHSFVGATCMIGLSFADESEASTFYAKVMECSQSQPQSQSIAPPAPAVRSVPQPSIVPPPVVRSVPPPPVATIIPIVSFAPPTEPSPINTPVSGMKKSVSTDSVKKADASPISATGSTLGGGLFGLGRSKSKKETPTNTIKKGKIDKSMISGPADFQHLSHVGYDPKTGFSAQNIPTEWKIIFAKAGITEEQLADKKTAKFVAKFMKEHGNADGSAPTRNPPPAPGVSRAPPPAIPSQNQQAPEAPRRQPPPLPPNRTSVGSTNSTPTARAPPPVPPSRNAPAAIPSPQVPNRAPPPPVSRAVPPPPAPMPQAAWEEEPVNAPPPPPRASAGPPPPPPPMPSFNAPPPPTIPSMPNPAPRSIPKPGPPAPDLFASIRMGIQLKAAEPVAEVAAAPAADDDLASALRNALQKRITAVAGSDSDEEEEDEW